MDKKQTKQVQLALLAMGYKLPRWGADGHWGKETEAALARFADDHSCDEPETSGEWMAAAVLALDVWATVEEVGNFPGLDMRPYADADDIAGRRKWADIDSILMHQTACVFGGAKEQRLAKVAINGAVTVKGEALRIHDPLTWVWHAQGYSARSYGIEVEGNYEGVLGDDSSFWRPSSKPNLQPTELTDAMVRAGQSLCRWVIRTVEAHGGQVKYMLTHRQAYPSKPSDPGEAIYKGICLPIMEEFGLGGGDQYRASYSYTSKGKRKHVKPGAPVPVEWNPEMPTGYRHRPKSGGTDKRGNPV